MRWLRYIMVLIALTGAVGAYLYHRAAIDHEHVLVDGTRNAVIDISQRVRYLKATDRIELNEFGWPEVIDPKWFKADPPRNTMLPSRHPWLEVASTLDSALDHPVQRVAINERLAGLWYNPAKGIIRARVPQTVSDEKAIELYNRINGASIDELFDSRPRKRILEDLLEEEEPEEFEEEQQQGVTIHRPDAPAEDEDDLIDEEPPASDEGAPVRIEDEYDPAGPVRIDDPPASDDGPVEEEPGAPGGERASV